MPFILGESRWPECVCIVYMEGLSLHLGNGERGISINGENALHSNWKIPNPSNSTPHWALAPPFSYLNNCLCQQFPIDICSNIVLIMMPLYMYWLYYLKYPLLSADINILWQPFSAVIWKQSANSRLPFAIKPGWVTDHINHCTLQYSAEIHLYKI